MWSFIQSSIILFILSIVILYLIHHLIEYLKDTYTTKKTKDIVGSQIQKYKQIMDDLYEKKHQQWIQQHYTMSESTQSNQLSEQELQSVNYDLDEFVKQLS
jgi:predicted PurR-regulated permease PerM